MKVGGIVVIALVALGVAMGLWLLVIGGGDVGLAQETTSGTPVEPLDGSIFECYRVLEGDTHQKPARLITSNFGGDGVVLTQLVMMCEQATKTDSTGQVSGGDICWF